MVVSDHGAQSMVGGIRVNEWLIREGYLTLREGAPAGPVKPDMIDWARTRVWGDGGYYSRIFLNVRGREPEGVDRAVAGGAAARRADRRSWRRWATSRATRSARRRFAPSSSTTPSTACRPT